MGLLQHWITNEMKSMYRVTFGITYGYTLALAILLALAEVTLGQGIHNIVVWTAQERGDVHLA